MLLLLHHLDHLYLLVSEGRLVRLLLLLLLLHLIEWNQDHQDFLEVGLLEDYFLSRQGCQNCRHRLNHLRFEVGHPGRNRLLLHRQLM